MLLLILIKNPFSLQIITLSFPAWYTYLTMFSRGIFGPDCLTEPKIAQYPIFNVDWG